MTKRRISTLLSVFIWGGGQFFIGKQRWKGLLFFAMQLSFIGIEMMTGYWIEYANGLIKHFKFRLHGGFLTKGIWGFVTLGTKAGARNGDHSTILLINGIITIIIFTIILLIFSLNLKDAYFTGKMMEKQGKCPTFKESLRTLLKKSFPYVVLSPILLLIAFTVIMPIAFSFLTAFTNYNKNHLPPGTLIDWVGFSNFTKLFKVPIWSGTFFSVLIWTVIWTICATFSTYFFGMFQAILLNSKYVKLKSLYRGIMILPWAIPQLISLLVFKNLLNGQFGPIGQLLIELGLADQRVPFLTDPFLAKITIILVNLWMGFPMFMIMIQGILSNIDKELYEAASIDGANGFQIFGKITFPLVYKATAPLVIMNLAGNFNGFGAIYFLTEGGPVNANYQLAGDTDILISWIYKLTLTHQMYDMAAVMCIILFIFIGSVSFWNFRRTQAFKEV
ncbi:carbohydrate ABC transporter membrane protein 1 (CUT1 family) [Mobilisporobacter senegalensis]|uniref:Maltose/maltodextrin transport system permease protein n=1 Tax=Mobilisporobacter senegalensis TaxID=1329262 RepID=A0A3N1XBF2_9FIRM|nr:sugar ABC transporter permease [Mobilisporobacter senegalensis]ROR23421.1 carbohydrate ABC transporter membrane protein 1 (CUT1 family) [Mobilisporobacter senegalensis]